MKSFFKTLVASILGFCIGALALTVFLFLIFFGILSGVEGTHVYKPQPNEILKIELSGILSDRTVDDPLAWLFGKTSQQQTLTDVLDAIRKAKENDHIKGIYLKNGRFFSAGTSSLSAIRRELKDFKASGKFIIAYGDDYSQACYYVSSMADKVLLNPQGMINLHGMASTRTFYKGLLEKLGVKMEIFKVGTFKSAVEPYMLDKMSDANKEQLASYMGNIWKNISSDIAEDRLMSVEQLNLLVDSGLIFSPARRLVKTGLADSLMYLPQVEEYLKRLSGAGEDIHLSQVNDLRALPFKNAKIYNDKIAVLFAEGEITTTLTGIAASEKTITDKEYVKELQRLKKDKQVKAVVLRINSPGGSGYVSEQIWHEIIALREEKPVVVSMGDVAASGGYYIACAANWIVAEPTTITGSIGVFGMFATLEGLYGKAGLSSDAVKTHTFADFGDLSRDMRTDEKQLVQHYVEHFYDVFLTRCAAGRNLPKETVDSIGQGRVWTGEQALAIGLVNELGGLDRAIEVAAMCVGLNKFSRVDYPEKKDFLSSVMDNKMDGVKMKIMQGFLDDEEYRHLMLVRHIKEMDIIQARLPFE
ncbi:MAG: signal peptide peptidase SppA [Dysgonamonadaceae bacterium]|jgi:protease-4|nr:signal peptide peptidase SppA [Dysgonamonadaceae bacterium]